MSPPNKPCIPGFDGIVENEHLCQDIAASLGMLAANSTVLTLDQSYVVVERYDRLPPAPGSEFPQRIHQEDVCQSLGLMPGRKYQEDGGPSIAQIVTLIRRVSAAPEVDVQRFIQANIFNWLIGGTDAHAKNYSFLISSHDDVRLAPLYDLSSQLPYPDLIAQKVAMKIGDHYEIALVGREDWQRVAQTCALDEQAVMDLIIAMAEALPSATAAAQARALADGLNEEVIAPLSKQLAEHAQARLESVTTTRSKKRPAIRRKPRR